MTLHRHMSIEVVQGAVGLLASIVAALVHALNLLISSPRPLVLLCTWKRNERVDLTRNLVSKNSKDIKNGGLRQSMEPAAVLVGRALSRQKDAAPVKGIGASASWMCLFASLKNCRAHSTRGQGKFCSTYLGWPVRMC